MVLGRDVPVEYAGTRVQHSIAGRVAPAERNDWQTISAGAPAELQAKLERFQANPSWAGHDLRIEGGMLQSRKKGPGVSFSREVTDTPGRF